MAHDDDQDSRPRGSTPAAVEKLGYLIASGEEYQPGTTLTLETVTARLAVSRAMAREVLQVLQQKRLVELHARIGATVLPVERWDVFDPQVIGWRLRTSPRFQVRALSELRDAIEPRAALLAAERASADVCRDLLSLNRRLRQLGTDPAFGRNDTEGVRHRDGYLAVDKAFHLAVLRGSQNEMFLAMAEPLDTALEFRIRHNWEGTWGARGGPRGVGGNTGFPSRPNEVSLWFHHGVAHAVEQGRPEAAEIFSRAIIAEIRERLAGRRLRADLRYALGQVDRLGMQEGEWEPFEAAVLGAAGSDDGA